MSIFMQFFLVTNPFDPSTYGKELEVGKAIVDQCARLGVKHLIFSSLPDVGQESKGKWNVPHFTDKAKIEYYIREKSKSFHYISFISPAFYYQNFQTFFKIAKNERGELSITLPHTKTITGVDITQVGIPVVAMLNYPDKFNGTFLPYAGENASPQCYVDIISERIGKKVTLHLVPIEEFAKFPFPGAIEIAHMFGYFNEYTLYSSKSWSAGKEIFPSTKSFKDWISGVDFPYEMKSK